MEITNKILLDIYDSAQHCTLSDFSEYALNEFKKVVHFDSAVIVDFVTTQQQKFAIQALHLHSVPIEKITERSKTLGDETLNQDGTLSSRDTALQKALAHRGKSVILDVYNTLSDPGVLNYCRKFETAHSLSFISGQATTGMLPTIGLWRATKKNAYLEKHAYAANLLLPHIVQAREINKRLKPASPAGVHGCTTVLATYEGVMYFVEQEAIRLLQLEWKQWTPPLLPRTLIDSLKQNKEKIFVGAAICVKASVQGNVICLVISAKKNQKSNLTTAEYRVTKLAVEGWQYKEIAKQLGVSPATVRNQLHSAYTKLGVSNKTALAAALLS